jgi:uncharacterized membrane protein YhhN
VSVFLIAAFVFAGLESLALLKGWRRVEYVVKPAVMIVLFLWLITSAGREGALLWFGLGVLFSLAGDVLLMLSLDRFFLPGLGAFLLAHLTYVIGFNTPLPEISVWGIGLAFIIGLGGARVIRRILASVVAKGQGRLRMPIAVYGIVISLMLLSAMLKQFDVTWEAGAALLVSVGAFLFYLSDIILAWSKFAAPIRNGRIYNIAAYHLGQIALIAGVIAQYSR